MEPARHCFCVIWDKPLLLTRLIEDCGFPAVHITPSLLAAPFFRGKYGTIIIPSGFADPRYSRVLPALRACNRRITDFISRGGVLLAFGGGTEKTDAYDWLPFPVTYHYGFCETQVFVASEETCCIIGQRQKKEETIAIDGYLESTGGHDLIRNRKGSVMTRFEYGLGYIFITTIHEYPSPVFIHDLGTRTSAELLL
ncbi:MAG: hypothetical protein JXA44_11040 [Methanospirillaceae archaeon]|nr:hypothetical protein [Methanospirillaceae archaeon]